MTKKGYIETGHINRKVVDSQVLFESVSRKGCAVKPNVNLIGLSPSSLPQIVLVGFRLYDNTHADIEPIL